MDAIDALRAARRHAGLSQTQLAAKLGKRQQFVSKYESGERRLDVIEYLDACSALDLPVAKSLMELVTLARECGDHQPQEI